ncbi:MAG: periplasmic polysaccharide biosynthesis/export protein [Zetaproteobacteria bacterium]|nr:MAG: periplasmic polysaccharide biosynthesis/export protein [Zetaproteobacteria bacterium]
MYQGNTRRALLLALAAVVFAAVPAVAQSPVDQTAPSRAEYVIGAQDVLTITVWDSPDLSGKFTVETDGSFTFPLIGRVKAGGLTLRQCEAELKKKLADGYFKNPQVSVAVESYRSQRIFIVGEVRNPGTYPLTGDMTLIEAIARAGSTTQSASPEALVVRAPPGKTASGPLLPGQAESEVLRVDLKELQSGALSQNIALRDGDTIFVSRAESIYVFGQVKNPGAYALQSADTTVLQALSLAGGVTDRGATNRIKIVRVVKGEKQEVKVKLTDMVLPGDTIIVPERYF